MELLTLEIVKPLLNQLKNQNKAFFTHQQIENFIAQLDQTTEEKSYSSFSEEIIQIWSSIEQSGRESFLADFNKCVILQLITQFPSRLLTSVTRFPDSVVDQFNINFQRILTEMYSVADSHYQQSNDLFVKDLGICRLKLIPVGPRVIELKTGFSRRVLISGGFKQFFKFLYYLFFIQRNCHQVFQTHVHLSLVKHFNQQAIHQSYLRIAELLQVNPEIQGLFGASWYYDPALEQISPHLNYLRKQQEDNGAWVFYSAPEESGNPFARSKTRKKLFEQGIYNPKIYLCVWPRKSLLNYCKKI